MGFKLLLLRDPAIPESLTAAAEWPSRMATEMPDIKFWSRPRRLRLRVALPTPKQPLAFCLHRFSLRQTTYVGLPRPVPGLTQAFITRP